MRSCESDDKYAALELDPLACFFYCRSYQEYLLAEAENAITLFVCPTKFLTSIVFVFSWYHFKSQEKQETMLKQNLGGHLKSILVFSSSSNWIPMLFYDCPSQHYRWENPLSVPSVPPNSVPSVSCTRDPFGR